jgi:hypothetical protein
VIRERCPEPRRGDEIQPIRLVDHALHGHSIVTDREVDHGLHWARDRDAVAPADHMPLKPTAAMDADAW